jgi:ABC-2 type transport system ATP-binding protein
MKEFSIETNGLTHRFGGDERALDDVKLRVETGSIYGFLGPNGAGKTTTLKLILGLLKKQDGEIRVFGEDFHENRVSILRRIGSMIESPSIYGHLTATENLRVLQKIYNCPKNRIDETLAIVGLAETAGKKAGNFSLGMKQRLSIACALLHEPELLILDEPTNGLDPNGILEIRELLRELNQQRGFTILISSHLLPEIEKLVTHVGIINRGRLLFQDTLDELLSKKQRDSRVVFRTSDAAATQRIIGEFRITADVLEASVSVAKTDDATIAAINNKLVANGVAVYAIEQTESDLEKIFFDVIEA